MINDSIEMKLDEMQKKKASLANLSLNKLSRKELLARKVRVFHFEVSWRALMTGG